MMKLSDTETQTQSQTQSQPRTRVDPAGADLTEPAALQRLLAAAFGGVRRTRVTVAFGDSAGVATAALDEGDHSHDFAAPVGCVAKLLTAELIRAAVAARHFGFDTTLLEIFGTAAARLGEVRVRHVLEHTHGLDDSLLAGPAHRQGFIDRVELLSRVARLRRLARPGAIYSYGHVGAWLGAAVLEQVHGRAYDALVRHDLLGPLGIAGAWRGEAGNRPLCAATGEELALTAAELARFLLQTHAATPRPHSVAAVTRLPGWNPLERAIRLGWKVSRGGWLGHQSAWPGASSYVRLEPQRRFALAVLSRDHAAAAIAAQLFGTRFAGLFELRGPVSATTSIQRWAGTYEHAAHVIEIEPDARGLRARVCVRDAHGRVASATAATLPAVGASVFLAHPPSRILPYAQFIEQPDEAATFLWNGRCVLRRSENRR